jgi:phosphatidylserine/phosphatidylglycerophosphate/cardiolipin synthase-like enzyme
MTWKRTCILLVSFVIFFAFKPASATERLCDASFENCLNPLVTLINNEKVEIDTAFWFMDTPAIANALIAAKNRGVYVRMLVDPRADDAHATNTTILAQFASGGFPMRNRTANGILHWKMMLFSGQGVVEFSGANYTGTELVDTRPYITYVDEAIYYCDDPAIVNSFRTKYDTWWLDTVNYANFANITQLTRSYAIYPIESEACAGIPNGCGMNFLPSSAWQDNYLTKVQSALNGEKVQADIDMFRITNAGVVDSVISAFNRGLPIRMIIDSSEYSNTARVWDRYNIDRLFAAGVPLKTTKHGGQNHEKSLLFHGQNLAVWGSSNWSVQSSNVQQEHNYFSTTAVKPGFFEWFQSHFERRWNSPQEYKAFVPIAPTAPVYKNPASAATGVAQSVTLTWDGGPWGQLFDIYLGAGASSVPKLIASDVKTGTPDPVPNHAFGTFKISGLAPNTTYKWKIVSKTMANLTSNGPIWSFTTGGSTPTAGATVNSVCVSNGACSPATGPSSGGTPVTITGTNFAPGATVSFDFASASSVVVVDSATITATAPAHVGGSATVRVTNQAGDQGSLPGAFLYTVTTPSAQPRLNVVVPDISYQGGGDLVTISGTNLKAGETVCFMVGGNCNQAVVSAATGACPASVCAQVTVPSGTPGTSASIVVTTPGGSSNALAFSYADPPSAPSIASISTSTGSQYGGTSLVIGGTGFRYGAVVSFGGPPAPIGTGTPATTMAVTDSPTLCGSVPLPCITANTPAHAVGNVDVVVTNMNPATGIIDAGSGMGTLVGGYTFVKAPSVTNVSPNRGTASGGTQVTITGTNFVAGAQVLVGNQPTTVVTSTASSITALTPANTSGATAPVTVVNPDGQGSNSFIYIYQ